MRAAAAAVRASYPITMARHVARLHSTTGVMGNRAAAVGWPRKERRAGGAKAVTDAGDAAAAS